MPRPAARDHRGAMTLPRWLAAILGVAALALVASGITLARRNRSLAVELQIRSGQWQATIGSQIPMLDGFDEHGGHLTVAFNRPGLQTIFLISTAGCPVCSTNWQNWRELVRWVAPLGVRFVAINSDSNYFSKRKRPVAAVWTSVHEW
ncbi:MAG: hypothetical protein ACRD1L_08315 [Terriglobales bacterium]